MPVPPADWSTHQLTQFLAAISTRAETEAAVSVGVERAAEALDADVGAFIQEGAVLTALGFPVGGVPEAALLAAAEAGSGSVDLPGLGRCQTVVVRGEEPLPGRLLLGRAGHDTFTRDEANLLGGMMRLLQLNDRMRRVLEKERTAREEAQRQADLNAALLASLEERHRLLQALSKLQRAISHRDPIADVLDAVTGGASERFGEGVELSLRMFDSLVLPVRPDAFPASPRPVDREAGWRAIAERSLVIVDAADAGIPLVPGGVATAMAAPVYREGIVVGSLVVAARQAGRLFTESEQETLLAFADHASLALTDAATIDAVRRQTELLKLLESVAVSANEATSVEEAVQTTLDRVCAYTHWPVGYAYFREEDDERRPVPSGCSHLEGPFAKQSPRLDPLGRELASRVLRTGRPLWITDIAELEPAGSIPAELPSTTSSLRGAFAFPVLVGRETLAVLEFFSITGAKPDRELRESMAQVGTQLGRVVERSRSATALRETTERTRLIIEAATDAFVSLDATDTISGWNQAAEAMFGWSQEEAVGRQVAEVIVAPAHRDTYRKGLRHYLAAPGEPASVVIELIAAHRDGRQFPVEAAVWPVRTGNGWEFNAFARDISARKRAQQELAAARDASLEASRLKSEFLATMSHEIRTPMHGILGMTRLLLATTLDADQRECAEGVERSAEALLAIINDILDISKIEAGKLELEEVDFDLGGLVADVCDLLSGSARAKGLELTATIAPDLPTAVKGDALRLRQVLTNLVGNAVKFTDQGSVSVRATLVGMPGEAIGVRVEVADTGIGIPAGNQASIFELFRQADASTTRRFGGTGLGLAITKQLVGMMGGEIGLESEPGAGSTFSFTVRLGKSVGAPTALSPLQTGRVALHPAGARILVVEDNPVNQRILVKTLERAGYRVDVRSTGSEAVDLVARNLYHTVLMDCQMPEMDGHEATRLVRMMEGTRRHTPIVAITASAMASHRDRCLAAGMDDFIAKPVKPLDLLVTVARWTTAADAGLHREPEPAPPSLDFSVIDSLRESLGPRAETVFRELVDLFLGDAPVSLDGLRAGLVAGNSDDLARAAHRLRGSASALGAGRLMELCGEAEELGWAKDLERASLMIPLIADELARVEGALRSELAAAS